MTVAETRYAMYQRVVDEFGDDDNEFPPEPTESLPRYCLVERDSHDNKWYDFGESTEQLLKGMECDDSDYLPHAVVDLDAGKVRLVRVRYDIEGSPLIESLRA